MDLCNDLCIQQSSVNAKCWPQRTEGLQVFFQHMFYTSLISFFALVDVVFISCSVSQLKGKLED